MANKAPDSLEQRVRDGASTFNFAALMPDSTQSGDKDAPLTPEERFESYLSAPAGRPIAFQSELIALDADRISFRRPRLTSSALITAGLGILALGGWILYLRQSDPSAAQNAPVRAAAVETVAAAQVEAKPVEAKIGLPRADLTPGERSATATIGTQIPDSVRRQVFAAYSLYPEDPKNVPVRLIPAAFGGTNGIKNVFPVTPWFAELKSRLDTFLIAEVRAGRMTPAQAESELTTNWVRACHVHYIRNYGNTSAEKARETEDQLRWK